MRAPAARIGDPHACPLVAPGPHIGGAVLHPGSSTVLIGGAPAARVGDVAACIGPSDAVSEGVAAILIGGLPAARVGCGTVHGGSVTGGCSSVLLGGPTVAGYATAQHATMSHAKRIGAALTATGCNRKGHP